MIASNYFRIYSEKDSVLTDTYQLDDYLDLEYVIGSDDANNFHTCNMGKYK